MGLPADISINLVWTVIRLTCLLLRTIIWLISGRYFTVRNTYKAGAYDKTVHVLSIWARHKLDLILQPSGADNFITVHNRFEDPDYVLQDHISLFYVNKHEAVFVETEKGIHVTDSDKGTFVRLAQFKNAKNLIIVPMHVFHKLGDKVGKTKAKIIFLYNTSRCGSTLLTQVFEETGKATAYSEPDALNAVTQLRGIVSDDELDRITTNTINILCKPVTDRQIECYILKPTQPTIAAMPHLDRLFPDSYNLFLYRDGLKVAKSLARAAKKMPLLGTLLVVGRTSPMMTKKMVVEMGLPSEQFNSKVYSAIHFCSIVWAGSVHQYLDYREMGHKIAAVRYEDLIADSKFSFQKIYDYVDLPFDGSAVEKAFSRDAQRGSPISTANLNQYAIDEFTPEVKKQTDMVCDSFRLPHFPDPYVLPGTITTKE